MNQIRHEVLQNRINNIVNSNFDVDDIRILLIDLREDSKKKSLIRELGDFVHPERSKGTTFEILKQNVHNLINDFTHGRKPYIAALTNYEYFISELYKELKAQNFTIKEDELNLRKNEMCFSLITALAGSSIKLDIKGVDSCELEIFEKEEKLELMARIKVKEEIKGPVFNWRTNTQFLLPVISSNPNLKSNY
ncbi:MAG: hypothetical protein H0U27_07020 [Nitrosopumilus sp.]|nr:hypothetical protein [Nitrosopumilus sp.]